LEAPVVGQRQLGPGDGAVVEGVHGADAVVPVLKASVALPNPEKQKASNKEREFSVSIRNICFTISGSHSEPSYTPLFHRNKNIFYTNI
jgi:hypothetical protein